jgi:hypothetical protein
MNGRWILWLFTASLLWSGCSGNEVTLSEQSDTGRPQNEEPGGNERPDTDDGEPERPGADAGAETSEERDAGPAEARLVSIVFDPLDSVQEVEIGVPQTFELTAWGTWSDGTVVELDPPLAYVSSDPEIASVSAAGVVTMTGRVAGRAEIRLTRSGFDAVGSVLVQLVGGVLDPGVDPEIPPAFDDAAPGDASTAPVWEYPEHETMFPSGMTPPTLQWNGNGNSAYRLRVTRGEGIPLTIYTVATELTFTEEQWERVANGDRQPIVLELSGLSADRTVASRAQSRVIYSASAALSGDVYYWQVETGDIMRIPNGETTPVAVFSDNATNGSCRGCHTMSRDGGRLGFMYNGGGDPRAGLAWVDTPETPIVANGSPFQWTLMAFDPTSTRAAAVYRDTMWLADVTPGLAGGVANLGPIPAGPGATMPNWSPDGSTLAFVRRNNPAEGDWSHTSGDLCVMPWDSVTQTFEAARTLLQASSEPSRPAIGWPSWSPDSQWLAINRGPRSSGADSRIYLVDPRTGDATHLARANPAGQDAVPSFSPYREGGFYWLLFYSTRPYGHLSTHKQLWVAAIDENMVSGVDGSYPAFWLPGQDLTRQNITGYWAPPVCANEGNTCKTPDECCAGQECLYSDAEGQTVCQTTDCIRDGLPCVADDDCCSASVCLPGLSGATVCQRRF